MELRHNNQYFMFKTGYIIFNYQFSICLSLVNSIQFYISKIHFPYSISQFYYFKKLNNIHPKIQFI